MKIQGLEEEVSFVKSCPRVLVVEDDEDLRTVVCEQLTRAAYTVRGVRDGIEAVMELEDRQWEVVLTDSSMPRLNGLNLLGIVAVRWPDTTVVMISGEPPDIAKFALKQGAFAWINKPYDPGLLLHTVQEAVQRALELRTPVKRGLGNGGVRDDGRPNE